MEGNLVRKWYYKDIYEKYILCSVGVFQIIFFEKEYFKNKLFERS